MTRHKIWTLPDFDLRATVGIGSFGRVRMVKIKGAGDRAPMALKILKKFEVIKFKQVEHVKAERTILSMLEHPFIVSMLTSFQDERRLFMLLEFVNGGELFSYVRNEGRLPNDTARFFAGEIVLAVAHMHSMHIAYRDLKPENVLIDCEGHIKITDFGFAKVILEDKTWTLCGTPDYLAPEIIQTKGHGKSVDWWALGVLTFEMLAGYPPFYDENPFGVYQKVLDGTIHYPRHIDVKAKDLIKNLLIADKTRRLGAQKGGAEDLKRHKWFKGIDWDLLLNRGVQATYVPHVKGHDDVSMYETYPESTESSAPAVSARDQELFEGFEAAPGSN
eukprot:TRINITY_DN111820_c0_g1_i1.p1 TRINITY_DN111820_c0_g1~~TRINITY_DN111820_c0_g1_i1.p1  ORF type:complete len:347 (-),score=55.37 TRINITY_DN111820_c0_g1_i1:37-1032(-)